MLKVRSLEFGVWSLFVICILFLGASLVGCGQSITPATTTTTSTTTTGTGTTTTGTGTTTTGTETTTSTSSTSTTLVGSVSIRGSIYTGTITAASIQACGLKSMAVADAPVSDYKVIAVGSSDNRAYFPDAKTDSTGSFEIANLPPDQSYYCELIDDQNRCIAPISFGPTSDAIAIAITPEAGNPSIELGKIVYDSALGGATPTIEPSSVFIDENTTARKSPRGDVPVGAGNLGGGSEAEYPGTLSTKPDEDLDGFPDVFDSDDNGNLVKDSFDPNPRNNAVEISVEGGNIHNFNFSCGTGVDFFLYPTYITDEVFNSADFPMGSGSVLMLEAIMNGGVSPSTFSMVRVPEGPAWCDSARTQHPEVQWSSLNYSLTKEADRWDIHLVPYGTPEAGDVCKLLMIDATTFASTETLHTLSTIFYNIPRLLTFADTTSTREATLPAYIINGNMFTYSGDQITLRWLPAKDDTGNNVTTNIRHQFEGIIYFDASGHTVREISYLPITPEVEDDPTYGTVYRYTFTPTTEAFDHFKLDIKTISLASSGGTAFQTVYFKKM